MQTEPTVRAAVATAPRERQTVFWIIALLLAVIATTLLVRGSASSWVAPAFGDSPMVGARGVFAFTGQLDKNSYGLFMVDVDNRTVWCYQYLPSTRKLRLVAARSFSHDRYLEDHNFEGPTIEVVKQMLEEQRRIKERREMQGIDDADDEALGITVPGMPSGADRSTAP
ncbi:MAG TPA: hypothetical protein VJZ71_03380 [Phycisphaerae bacterium]|nr:hypothetical protein [Phycisphaerae bacterium]